jgi:hypothetical protein
LAFLVNVVLNITYGDNVMPLNQMESFLSYLLHPGLSYRSGDLVFIQPDGSEEHLLYSKREQVFELVENLKIALVYSVEHSFGRD